MSNILGKINLSYSVLVGFRVDKRRMNDTPGRSANEMVAIMAIQKSLGFNTDKQFEIKDQQIKYLKS